jgi:hypothetical protein
MKYNFVIILFLFLGGTFIFSSCDHRIDFAPFDEAVITGSITDTSYVEINPAWGGFTSPRAILIGNDQLIYVADYDANQVLILDAGGATLGRRTMLHPTALAQNSKLDLYVTAEAIAPNGTDTLAVIYKIALVRLDTSYVTRLDTVHNPNGSISIVPVTRDTSYYYNHQLDAAPMKTVRTEAAKPHRRFPGIAVLPNNDYLVARTGTDNSSFVDPDSRLLLFNGGDTLLSPIPDLVTRSSGGTAVTDIRYPTGIFVFPSLRDFILTQSSDGVAYGAIWMVYNNTINFQGYLPKYDPSSIEQRGTDFILSYRYQNAVAAAYDKRKREIFILDSELDSVSKFTSRGVFKKESFGKALTSQGTLPALKNPMGIAFSNDCTLYIADTGNGIIRRFRLSTQTTCY